MRTLQRPMRPSANEIPDCGIQRTGTLPRRLSAVAIFLGSLSWSTACAEGGPRDIPLFRVRDSADVVVAENRGPLSPVRWQLADTPSLVIGGDDVQNVPLFRVSSATRSPDGEIAVANSGTREFFIFAAGGERIAIRGGAGGGPGEFQGLSGIKVVSYKGGELIGIQSGFREKWVRYDSAGGVHEMSSSVQSRGNTSSPEVAPGGIAFYLNTPTSGPSADGLTRDVVRRPGFLIRFSYGGSGPDTIAEYPGDEVYAADIGPRLAFGGGTVSGPSVLWPAIPAYSDLAGGGEPWRLIVGDRALPSFDVYDSSGSLVRRVRWEAMGQELTARDRERLHDEFISGSMGQMEPSAARRAWASRPEQERTPVFRSLLVDRRGCFWVERHPLPSDSSVAWWVFDDEGRSIAFVQLAADLHVLEVGGDYVLAVKRDELDVEQLQLWQLIRQGSGSVQAD